MSLDKSHLAYPHRRYGMDHDWYPWSMLSSRPAITWPNGAKLALWVNVNVQYFPLNQASNPVAVPGGMKMPYPDLRHYSLRDYGNRVGIYRVLQALDHAGVTPTFAINGAMVAKAPYLMAMLKERGNEVIGHGWQMDHLQHGQLAPDIEARWIENTLTTLREHFEQPVTGWLSPGKLQSASTPSLLKAQGIDYMCDWVNDDMPYRFSTAAGDITAMPLSTELDDFFILTNNLHSEDSYVEQLTDACDFLLNEAEQAGGRLLALTIHPWLLGQPHRIACLEQVLRYLTSKSGVWSASATAIRQSWLQQQG